MHAGSTLMARARCWARMRASALLPKGSDKLAKQVALAVSLVVAGR